VQRLDFRAIARRYAISWHTRSRVDLTRSPSPWRMTGICANATFLFAGRRNRRWCRTANIETGRLRDVMGVLSVADSEDAPSRWVIEYFEKGRSLASVPSGPRRDCVVIDMSFVSAGKLIR
jgi:hypothetical protein